MQKAGAELGGLLAQRAIDALRIDGAAVHSYGKAAIVGEKGEREHAAAVMHPRLGKPVREIVGPARSSCPPPPRSADRERPLIALSTTKDEVWKFSHFDSMQVSVPDAPRADEIVVVLAISDSGRPLHRVGEDLVAADVMAKKE